MDNLMSSTVSTARKWGNSIGITLPSDLVRHLNISEGDEVEVVIIKKVNPLRKWFGKLRFKKSVKQMMEETDTALYNE